MSLEYKDLTKVSSHEIHQCFLDSFSDYLVEMKMSESAFCEMNELRGVDPSISLGAWDGDQLVGFTLNGLDSWNGKLTAYDAGTGVIPRMRGQGIGKEIMQKSFDLLLARGMENYLLEVIASNSKALNLYQSLGFRMTRKLECLILKDPRAVKNVTSKFLIEDISQDRWSHLSNACNEEGEAEFQASWQNSWNSIRRRPDLFHVVGCLDQGKCLGYGIIMVGRGSIAQIWVSPSKRRQGLGTLILQRLLAKSPSRAVYSWVNVDSNAEHTLGFLNALEFKQQLSQYEMERGI